MVLPDEIFARISDVHDELARLVKHLDEFPAPSAISHVTGSTESVARPFGVELQSLASGAASQAKVVMQELADMDSAVRAALEDLSAQDEELATTAERLESFLDSSEKYTDPASSPTADQGTGVPVPASGAAAGGDAWGEGEG